MMTLRRLAVDLRMLVAFLAVVALVDASFAVGPPEPPADAFRYARPDGGYFVVGGVASGGASLGNQAFAVWKRKADGTPDTAFNVDGFAMVPFWGVSERAQGLAVQPDGKIVVAGHAYDPSSGWQEDRTAIARFDPDGLLDRTFSGDGRVALVPYLGHYPYGTSFDDADVAILADGVIEIRNGPFSRSAYARVSSDGTLLTDVIDNTFGMVYSESTEPTSLANLPGLWVPTQSPSTAMSQGLWYAAPAESEAGWGISFAHQDDVIFGAWFTYDAAGRPLWLSMTLERVRADGRFDGAIVETTGPSLDSLTFEPARVTRTTVGTASVSFADVDHATFTFDVRGARGAKALVRQTFGPLPLCIWATRLDPASVGNYQDLWWASPAGSEAGWGVNLAHQGDTIFATWFTYGRDGAPLWLSGTATKIADGRYAGTLNLTTGPAFDAIPWDKSQVTMTAVGTFTLDFADGDRGTFGYRLALGGTTVELEKPITRQVFREPGTTCR